MLYPFEKHNVFNSIQDSVALVPALGHRRISRIACAEGRGLVLLSPGTRVV